MENQLREMSNILRNCQNYDKLFEHLMKPSPKIYLLDLCELKDRHIEVVYHDEKTPEEVQEDCIDPQEVLLWMIKNSKHVITHEGHNHKGVLDQWTHTYNPEDLLADPLSRYQLVEEFINETENRRMQG